MSLCSDMLHTQNMGLSTEKVFSVFITLVFDTILA